MRTKGEYNSFILRLLFAVILSIIVVFFVVGELFMPGEDPTEQGKCTVYEADWERVTSEGTREKITIPGNCTAKRREVVRIETTLSKNIEDTWFCMRASQQDMRVYIGDELRKEYTTEDTRIFGRNSASAYVFFPVYEKDAGELLAIEVVSDSEYSGFLNKVYIGEKNDIVNELIRQCLLVLGVSLYMLVLSSLIVFAGLILQLIYKKKIDMIYLGIGTLILSCSMTVESNIRQFFMSNGSIASHVGFLLTILIPYPFMVYVSRLQKERYDKYYRPLAWTVMINFFISSLLQAFDIVDLIDSTVVSYATILVMVVIMIVTICRDIKQGRRTEYGEVLYGLVAMIIAAVWETCITFIPDIPYQGGVVLSVGLVILLFTAAVKTAREMMALEREKQVAIEASRAKANFLANMSHEIRTPINTIIGMNEMILRENKDSSVQEYANNVNNASKMLLGLVNDVLDFSKIESGKLEVVEAEYSLAKMLTDVVNGVRLKAENKNLKLVTLIEESLPSVLYGDELRIRQILNNLLSNAVKYTKQGTITLTVKRMPGEEFILHMSVEDTGMGIKQEDLNKLFDSFQRLEEDKNRYIEGTGLGLNITKQLAELMGGSIEVVSEYRKGSCFVVHMPQKIVDGTPMGKLKNVYEKEINKRTAFHLSAPTAEILVVDDNRMNLAVVNALLKRTEARLTLVTSGLKCLEICRKKKFDLILMDHMMPDPDGIETLHQLRKDEESLNTDTVAVVLTANAIAGMADMYIAEGFTDYLSKPIVAEQLEVVIEKYLPKEKISRTKE